MIELRSRISVGASSTCWSLRGPLIIGIQFSGAVTLQVSVEPHGRFLPCSAVKWLQALHHLSDETWLQNVANDRVWVKLRGRFWQFCDLTGEEVVPSSDELLYANTTLQLDQE